MAVCTGFANVAAATAAGWSLRQGYHGSNAVVRNGLTPALPAFAIFSKKLNGDIGNVGAR